MDMFVSSVSQRTAVANDRHDHERLSAHQTHTGILKRAHDDEITNSWRLMRFMRCHELTLMTMLERGRESWFRPISSTKQKIQQT